MATAHIIPVPVETLEIIELPGKATFEEFVAKPNARGAIVATLTLKTDASSHSFKRRVVIDYVILTDAHVFTDDEGYQTVDGEYFFGTRADLRNAHLAFRCKLGGSYFEGAYRYTRHSGNLVAIDGTGE